MAFSRRFTLPLQYHRPHHPLRFPLLHRCLVLSRNPPSLGNHVCHWKGNIIIVVVHVKLIVQHLVVVIIVGRFVNVVPQIVFGRFCLFFFLFFLTVNFVLNSRLTTPSVTLLFGSLNTSSGCFRFLLTSVYILLRLFL